MQRVDGLSFREAASRLGADLSGRQVTLDRSAPVRTAVRSFAQSRPIDTELLAAAVELYSNRLVANQAALGYLTARGFGRELLERERNGFAAGGGLVSYLAWRGFAPQRARRAGLLGG